ncbi:phosphoserine phosphatase SerB [Shewanella sp. JM162201]|uniref:Phosphoserine phosphatase n=1 Tax=Shewanella jiangmenensis TaxID=2837387 RepID=A0ABS5V1H7_9GAMM|nr:phosphoserine phosphatase SerB [Shewanella jiangmenensis]MBT1443464.1 phosphoserine phosphatase SerB [Shewanella jiangmenensis]
MENTRTSHLAIALSELASAHPQRIRMHTEQEVVASTCVRLVWDAPTLTPVVLAKLAEFSVSVAVLQRHNALFGLEVLTDDGNAVASACNAVAAANEAALECFVLTSALARLSVPGLLVMDMDSTAIKIECIDELAAMAGVGEAVAEVTERAMQGELDFEQSLRLRVSKLAGADAAIIDDLCSRLPLMEGLTEMLAELKSHGWRLALASGGFTPFVGHLKAQLGLDAAFANELVIVDGKLTGEVTGTVVDAKYKADVVSRLGAEYGMGDGQCLAIGDGANDIPMVQRADFGIAFHAKPKLAAAAKACINTLDLRVLPFLLRA